MVSLIVYFRVAFPFFLCLVLDIFVIIVISPIFSQNLVGIIRYDPLLTKSVEVVVDVTS